MNQSSTNAEPNAEQKALEVIQQAVWVLAEWTNSKLKEKKPADLKEPWNSGKQPGVLRTLFDSVKLSNNEGKKQLYWKPDFIADVNPQIPYPSGTKPSCDDLRKLQNEIKQALDGLDDKDLNNLSLLTLILEKYGSFISFGESDDVALVDIAKSKAAVAAALANNSEAKELCLIAGDLSGIQSFIYTISSDGALKSLRARSFYLELVTEEVVQQILEELKLPRTNVIYAGGGNIYILAPGIDSVKNDIEEIRQQFNKWLLDRFQGKVFLALDRLEFPQGDIKTEKFAQYWSGVTKQLAEQKSRKFAENITDFIQVSDSHEPCKVCHRDDVEELKLLNKNEPDSVLACGICREMFQLGGQLLKVDSIVRSLDPSPWELSQTENSADDKTPKLSFKLPAVGNRKAINVYYYLFETWKPIVEKPETVLLVNDWTIEHYKFRHFSNPVALLLGNYGKATENPEESGFIRAEEMAEKAKGIDRVGYLRMDVDNLGRIFAEGLGQKKTLPTIAGLSRQMSYFFKVYLNSLAKFRNTNIPENSKKLTPQDNRLNLLFIYAGGDDLFVSGAWNEVVEFAFDVYQSFRAYTGHNPDITLSGGVSIADAKFPLYQAAKTSGNAEEAAKGNDKDSLGLFGETFKWDEWLGIEDITTIETDIRDYLKPETKPSLLGILPFVNILEQEQIGLNYSHNFVRNLLITAQVQEEALKELKDKKEEAKRKGENKKEKSIEKEIMGTRYFLHLPKVAYTLARLPNNVLNNEDFRTSLKSPYNAPYFRAIATWIELLHRS